jgi:hypothetical protein
LRPAVGKAIGREYPEGDVVVATGYDAEKVYGHGYRIVRHVAGMLLVLKLSIKRQDTILDRQSIGVGASASLGGWEPAVTQMLLLLMHIEGSAGICAIRE